MSESTSIEEIASNLSYKLKAAENCDSTLTISRDGHVCKECPIEAGALNKVLTVKTDLSIPSGNKEILTRFYFEMEICANHWLGDISIGFCDKNFALKDQWIGLGQNSIGIRNKKGINVEKAWTKFNEEGQFKKGEVIGIGIRQEENSKMECFATLDGTIIGTAELPEKFRKMNLHPAITVFAPAEVRVNFGREAKFK